VRDPGYGLYLWMARLVLLDGVGIQGPFCGTWLPTSHVASKGGGGGLRMDDGEVMGCIRGWLILQCVDF
jgi:hypothetical protein